MKLLPSLIPALLFVLLTFVSVRTAHAEPVHLFVDLQPGWTERYQLRSRIEVKADDHLADRLQQNITLRLAAVAREEGAATLRATVERIDVTHTSAEDTVQVRFPHVDEEPEHDESAALAHIYASLHEAVLEFEVSPSGRVQLVAGLNTALTAAQAAAPENPARLLGLFAPGALERTITSIITLDPQREARDAGERWHDEQLVPVLGRQAKMATEYRLGEAAADEARVEGTITVALEPAEAPTPTAPQITIAEQSGELAARWDTGARHLIERRTEMRIVWRARLVTEPPIESHTTATSRLWITHLPELPQEP